MFPYLFFVCIFPSLSFWMYLFESQLPMNQKKGEPINTTRPLQDIAIVFCIASNYSTKFCCIHVPRRIIHMLFHPNSSDPFDSLTWNWDQCDIYLMHSPLSRCCVSLFFVPLFPTIFLRLWMCLWNRQIDGVAPTFVKKPAIRQEDDGKRLLFECKIKADPKPTVTWSHNATVVDESKRHKVNWNAQHKFGTNLVFNTQTLSNSNNFPLQQTVDKQEGQSYFASLEINNVTVEDAGKYKVTAKNELGESNATISLNFDSEYNLSKLFLFYFVYFVQSLCHILVDDV